MRPTQEERGAKKSGFKVKMTQTEIITNLQTLYNETTAWKAVVRSSVSVPAGGNNRSIIINMPSLL